MDSNDNDDNDDGIGLSDSVLHITSSKPPLPRGHIVHRNRSRSIETATLKSTYRHSMITNHRIWSRQFSQNDSVHDYDEAAKAKR